MAKSVADYLASERTETQEQFLAWVFAETGAKFKTAAEAKAFDLGVRAAGLYSRFQAARREAPASTPTTTGPTRTPATSVAAKSAPTSTASKATPKRSPRKTAA